MLGLGRPAHRLFGCAFLKIIMASVSTVVVALCAAGVLGALRSLTAAVARLGGTAAIPLVARIGSRPRLAPPGTPGRGQWKADSKLRFGMGLAPPGTPHTEFDETNPALALAAAQRRLLPTRIILVRHGESEANADHSLLRHKPDNIIELTDKGTEQAMALGTRIKGVVGDETVSLVVSPFERTQQTARNLRLALDEEQIIRTTIEPRLREQEFGNLQGDEFRGYRDEQTAVGRFWYRFPTGESGADVHGRVSQWFESVVPQLNLGGGGRSSRVQNLIVVRHLIHASLCTGNILPNACACTCACAVCGTVRRTEVWVGYLSQRCR